MRRNDVVDSHDEARLAGAKPIEIVMNCIYRISHSTLFSVEGVRVPGVPLTHVRALHLAKKYQVSRCGLEV